MSHQEQHFAGIHYRGQFVPGMVFDNDYDHHAVPLGYQHAPNLKKSKHCVVCDSAMFVYLHYPVEKRLRTIWIDCLFLFHKKISNFTAIIVDMSGSLKSTQFPQIISTQFCR